jgi:large subunit ribosomal protein L6
VSRIGKNPIIIPPGVNINYNTSEVEIQGPKGKLSLKLRPEINIEKNDNSVSITRKENSRTFRAMHGLYRVLVNNMILGVTKGFEKRLEIIGTGYKAAVDGKKLVLNLGFSIPYVYNIPEGIKVTVENNTNVLIEGINKQMVGEVAAVIRKMKPPEPYKGKGIKYVGEHIRRKAGKATK